MKPSPLTLPRLEELERFVEHCVCVGSGLGSLQVWEGGDAEHSNVRVNLALLTAVREAVVLVREAEVAVPRAESERPSLECEPERVELGGSPEASP